MKSSAKKIELASVDDLFSTEEGRQDAKLEKIQEIPLSELHPFKNHPFKVKDDEAMMETADSIALLRETYGSKIKVFGTEIPHSVRAKEISAEGKSIFAHDPVGKVAEGYKNLTKEVLTLEKQRENHRAGLGR